MFKNWIRKLLGYHVCEEFTRWRTVVKHLSRATTFERNPVTQLPVTIEWTERYQERECTICGKIQQIRLKHL